MKKYLLILTVLFFISCDSDDSVRSAKKDLKGKWNWINSMGGFAGTVNTPETEKKTIILEFTDTTVKTFVDGNLQSETKFQIQTHKSIYGGERKMIVTNYDDDFTSEFLIKKSFEIKDDELILSDECSDCYVSKYKRIKSNEN